MGSSQAGHLKNGDIKWSLSKWVNLSGVNSFSLSFLALPLAGLCIFVSKSGRYLLWLSLNYSDASEITWNMPLADLFDPQVTPG